MQELVLLEQTKGEAWEWDGGAAYTSHVHALGTCVKRCVPLFRSSFNVYAYCVPCMRYVYRVCGMCTVYEALFRQAWSEIVSDLQQRSFLCMRIASLEQKIG